MLIKVPEGIMPILNVKTELTVDDLLDVAARLNEIAVGQHPAR